MKSKTFVNELKSMSKADLIEKGRGLREELMKVNFRNAVGQLNQGHIVRELRRNIARVETMLKGQQLKGQ